MKTYLIDSSRAAYHILLDILYVGYGTSSLDLCHSIEGTSPGITIMYDENGAFAGAEIPFFSKKCGELPATIEVDSTVPFELLIPAAASF